MKAGLCLLRAGEPDDVSQATEGVKAQGLLSCKPSASQGYKFYGLESFRSKSSSSEFWAGQGTAGYLPQPSSSRIESSPQPSKPPSRSKAYIRPQLHKVCLSTVASGESSAARPSGGPLGSRTPTGVWGFALQV